MYYPCSENKGADQLRGYSLTAKLICIFVFAYADCWFSHEAAQLLNWHHNLEVNHIMRKPKMWFLTRSDTNRAVPAQKMA